MSNYSDKLKNPKWQKKRLEILQRDEFMCQACGDKDSTLHVHHITYSDGEPWDINESFLITLCERCHEQEEEDLRLFSLQAIKELRDFRFDSNSFRSVSKIFETDRGWMRYEPAFDIIKMVVDDDELWAMMYSVYWHRVNNRIDEIKPFP